MKHTQLIPSAYKFKGVTYNADKLASLVLDALDACEGRIVKACNLLDISYDIFLKTAWSLALWKDIDKIKSYYYTPCATRRQLVGGRLRRIKTVIGNTTSIVPVRAPVYAPMAPTPRRRHVPVRFDDLDPALADDEDGWSSFP